MLELRSFDVREEIVQMFYTELYYWQCFNFWNDLLGWEYIQTRQKQTESTKQPEGRWAGGEKARKYRHSLSSIDDKTQRTILVENTK